MADLRIFAGELNIENGMNFIRKREGGNTQVARNNLGRPHKRATLRYALRHIKDLRDDADNIKQGLEDFYPLVLR